MANRSQGKRDANSAEHPLPTSSMECPFNKLATEAFLVFDEANNETVDVREVGTIIRSLGKQIFHLSSAFNQSILEILPAHSLIFFKRMLSFRVGIAAFSVGHGRGWNNSVCNSSKVRAHSE